MDELGEVFLLTYEYILNYTIRLIRQGEFGVVLNATRPPTYSSITWQPGKLG